MIEGKPTLEQAVFANPEQAQRDRALRRFNWLYVYLPLGVSVAAALTLLILLAVADLPKRDATLPRLTSGLTDVVLILWLCPTVLVCSLLPLGALALLTRRRQRGSWIRQRLQRLLWRLEDGLTAGRQQIDRLTPRLAQPVIRGRAWLTYIQHLILIFRRRLHAWLARWGR